MKGVLLAVIYFSEQKIKVWQPNMIMLDMNDDLGHIYVSRNTYDQAVLISDRFEHDTQLVHDKLGCGDGQDQNPPHGGTGKIDPDGYNVYAVEILPDRLVFSINGKHTFTYPKIETDKEGQWPIGTPFYLLVDMQIEGSWVGKADPSQYPVKMEVDWVKMYELENASEF